LQGKSPLGFLGLAEAQLAANDAGAAGRTVRRALEVAPGHLGAQRLGITAAMRQKQPAQALAIAREVQQQRPDQAVGYLLEGEIEIAQKRWDTAMPALRKAMTLAEPAQAPERLHQVLRQTGKAADADALERSWLKDHPRDALFLFYLGDVALASKDLVGAEQRYQAVLAVAPEHALSLNNIAWLLMQQNKPGALAYAERAVRAAPGRPALMDTLALALAAEQQPAKAIELQKQALAMLPDDPSLRLNLARFYAQAGEKRLAKTELDRLAALGDRFARQDEVAVLSKSLGGRQN
jgi:putative PEP-CTERM system TPR-repeat lipoprotein